MSIDTSISLNAQPRTANGGNAAGRLRRAGFIPVTIYGGGQGAVVASVNRRELGVLIRAHGRHAIITLNFDGVAAPVKISEMQLDPVKSAVRHLDLQRISLTERSEFEVDLKIVGESEGVKIGGGILDVVAHTIKLRCLPGDLPEHFDVDVTALGLGQHFRAGEISLDPDKFQLVTDTDAIIVNVVAPKTEEVVAEAAVAEPEVIKKGKDDKK